MLHHVHVSDDGEDESSKLIGVYSSQKAAEAAIDRLRHAPGFCDHVEGFQFTEYELDKDHWVEGFISWQEAADG